MPKSIKSIIAGILVVLAAILAGGTVGVVVNTESGETEVTVQSEFQMELADEQVPTIIETEEGETEVIEAPTVEFVDSDLVSECGEDEECGQGSYAPTETYTDFKNYVLGKCFDEDGHFGAQCWDLAQLFWTNYTGRTFSTCGTGAAKGAWNCKEQNAGDQFELITDTHSLQAGDWLIFTNGKYGHVGMALGGYNNGYIALLGQNQGGVSCNGGGSSANIINISLASFAGAFRPKTYIVPAPEPETPAEPVVDTCDKITLKKGDTLGKIMKKCLGKVEWGQAMDNYAKSWVDEKTGVVVFDGWYNSDNGVGLYAGHTIVRK